MYIFQNHRLSHVLPNKHISDIIFVTSISNILIFYAAWLQFEQPSPATRDLLEISQLDVLEDWSFQSCDDLKFYYRIVFLIVIAIHRLSHSS